MRAVEASHLTKSYSRDTKALNDVSFAIGEGEVFGFLGPNGAGKTTAVKLLNGMLAPTEGSCRVMEIDPAQNPEAVHQLAGVVTEHAQMYDSMTGRENLVFFGSMFGLDSSESEKRALALLKKLGLSDAKEKKLSAYSTGMRQRLSLARALIHRPRILFLDEPTSGLDPESVLDVNLLIRDLARNEGTTVFLCTHQLRYAQEICTCYGLIDRGRLLATGDIEELRAMVSPGMRVRIRADSLPAEIGAHPVEPGAFEVNVRSEAEIPAIVRKTVESGGNITHVSAHSASLEEIYFALLEKRNAGKEARK